MVKLAWCWAMAPETLHVFAAYFGAFQMSLQTGTTLKVRWFNLYSLMDGLQILPPGVSEKGLSAPSNAIYGQTGATVKALQTLMFLSVQINHAFDSSGWR